MGADRPTDPIALPPPPGSQALRELGRGLMTRQSDRRVTSSSGGGRGGGGGEYPAGSWQQLEALPVHEFCALGF